MQSCYLLACAEIEPDCIDAGVRVCLCVWEGGEDDHRKNTVCLLACSRACGPNVVHWYTQLIPNQLRQDPRLAQSPFSTMLYCTAITHCDSVLTHSHLKLIGGLQFLPRFSSPFMSPIASTGSLMAPGSVHASFIWCKISPWCGTKTDKTGTKLNQD